MGREKEECGKMWEISKDDGSHKSRVKVIVVGGKRWWRQRYRLGRLYFFSLSLSLLISMCAK